MSKKTRRRLDAGLKAKVGLEALRNQATVAELADRWSLRLGEPYQPGGLASWVAPASDAAG